MRKAKTDVMQRLARDLQEAIRRTHDSLPINAKRIGISASALRKLATGKSGNCRGETLLKILDWANEIGYSDFAGFHFQAKHDAGGAS